MKGQLDIIAEAAQGFEGDARQARLLVIAAASAGADAVKFQLVYADELATPDYQYYPLFKELEMEDQVWEELAALATSRGIRLDFDIFGARSLALAERIGGDVKLHGTDISNLGFLDLVAASSVRRVVLGAGGATCDEIYAALDRLHNKDVVLMLGFQAYPTQTEDNQIERIRTLAGDLSERANVIVGFGDHCLPGSKLSVAVSATALGAGAKILEKHITLGRCMELEDHESALNPDEFATYVAALRAASTAIGHVADNADFGMSDAEHQYRKTIRRHVIAATDLPAGKTIIAADIMLKRSAHPAPITDPAQVLGKTTCHAVAANSAFGEDDLE